MYIVFIYYSAVPNCFRYQHNACFSSLQFQIVSDTNIMHALVLGSSKFCLDTSRAHVLKTLFSKCSLQFHNRFKYRQNAFFRDIVFKMFTEVIRIVSNSVRLHALPRFQNCLCSSKISFQIASECPNKCVSLVLLLA